ncbi:MAG: PAS domain-containing sensor histidine kinase [Saprospiraceae bacterium]|nr:PAS domain-containing sensor histidine kinase [Saprospiraceae bacterium]
MLHSDLLLRLKSVFETAVDGIIVIDEKGIIEELNPSAARLFQYDVTELVGKNVSLLMQPDDSRLHDGYLENYKRTGVAKIIGIGREVQGLTKSGKVFPFWLSVNKVQLDDKLIFTGFIHDLTDVRLAEKRLNALNHELEDKVVQRTYELESVINRLLDLNKRFEEEIKAHIFTESLLKQKEKELTDSLAKEKELGELKSRFVSMASHEFRTPLSTILSSAALLSRYTEAAQQENRDKHILKIKAAVYHLTGILNDFLSLSKVDEGKIVVHSELFNLKNMGTELIEELSTLLKEKQQINYSFIGSEEMICTDAKILKNVLINILANAIKYSEAGTEINFDIIRDSKFSCIHVKDQGIGIPEADQKYLFERFFRASNVTNMEGTGLGLHIVKKYLELLNAEITYSSRINEGSTFTITIPEN